MVTVQNVLCAFLGSALWRGSDVLFHSNRVLSGLKRRFLVTLCASFCPALPRCISIHGSSFKLLLLLILEENTEWDVLIKLLVLLAFLIPKGLIICKLVRKQQFVRATDSLYSLCYIFRLSCDYTFFFLELCITTTKQTPRDKSFPCTGMSRYQIFITWSWQNELHDIIAVSIENQENNDINASQIHLKLMVHL